MILFNGHLISDSATWTGLTASRSTHNLSSIESLTKNIMTMRSPTDLVCVRRSQDSFNSAPQLHYNGKEYSAESWNFRGATLIKLQPASNLIMSFLILQLIMRHDSGKQPLSEELCHNIEPGHKINFRSLLLRYIPLVRRWTYWTMNAFWTSFRVIFGIEFTFS